MRKIDRANISILRTVSRWCACLVVCCSLALGATSLLATEPAHAICQIDALAPVYECQYFAYYVTVQSYVGSYTGPDSYTCAITGFSGYQKPALPPGITINGATISGCAPAGSAGTYHLGFLCQEYKNLGFYPAGGAHSYEKYVDFTIIAGAPGCTCTGTGGTTGGGYYYTPPPPPAPSTYKFTVKIGPGLTEGQTEVLIDGKKKAELGGGESEEFEVDLGTSPVVSVKSPITGQQGNRFTVKGDAEKKVSEGDTSAYFDYAPAVYIEFATDPPGLTALSGTDWYSVGDRVQSSAPAYVDASDPGTRYTFLSWTLPNGQKSQMKSLSLTASAPATVTASYVTYYRLNVSSPYSPDDTTWQKAGEEATWQVKNPQVSMDGIMGMLGGEMKAVNASGQIMMDGPKSVAVQYQPSYPWLVFLLIAAVVIGGGLFAFFRLKAARAKASPAMVRAAAPVTEATTEVKAAAPAAAPLPEKAIAKETETEAKTTEDKPRTSPKFCPGCGDPVDKEENFCNNCGRKLK